MGGEEKQRLLPALIVFGTIVTIVGAGIIAVPKNSAAAFPDA
jgi:hypothetical protein